MNLKKLLSIVLIVLSLGFSTTGFSEEVHLSWAANPGPDIQCYRIYMGTQVNMTSWTWERVGEVNATEFVYNVPVDTLRLFRISACDRSGREGIRYDAGIFSCFEWTSPQKPTHTGIE